MPVLSRVHSPFLVSDGGRLGAVNGVKRCGPTGNRGYAQINTETAFRRGPFHLGITVVTEVEMITPPLMLPLMTSKIHSHRLTF